MKKTVYKKWHKLALIAIMVYFSGFFTTLCVPAMLVHHRIPTLNFYILSNGVFLIGGIIFNTVLSTIYTAKKELKSEFPKDIVFKVLGIKMFIYTTLGIFVILLTDEFIIGLYYVLFLMVGGYSWICILQGYIKLINDKEKRKSEDKNDNWIGRILTFSIALSLLLGFLYICIN